MIYSLVQKHVRKPCSFAAISLNCCRKERSPSYKVSIKRRYCRALKFGRQSYYSHISLGLNCAVKALGIQWNSQKDSIF